MYKRHPESLTFALKDGTRLRVLRWKPEAPTTHVFLIQHGHGEHAGRYQTYANELAELPLDIWSFDTRGHGHADGPRGHAERGLHTMADDLAEVIGHVKEKVPGAKIHLMGHSMGGAVVGIYLTTRTPDPAIQDVIISAGLMRIPRTPVINAKLAFGRLLNNVIPTVALSTGLPASGISSDPTEVKRYKDDALVHSKASIALGVSWEKDGEALPAQAHKVTLPLLAFHGSADPIVDPAGTRAFFDGAGSTDKTWVDLPGSRHEAHHEVPDKRAALFDAIRTWLKPRLSA